VRNNVATEASLTLPEIALTADIIGAVGSADFYDRLLCLLDERIQCERRLVIKYSRFARPEILVNASLDTDAVGIYLNGLYRLDPLLRLLRDDTLRPVVTYREIRLVDHENAFYDEIFRSGRVLDELAVLLPTVGGACIALCFDRDEGYFGSHEVEWASMLYPILRKAHELHVRTAMPRGLAALFGDGDVGILALGEDDAVIYRNDAWTQVASGADEALVVARTLAAPEGMPTPMGNRVAHWAWMEPAPAQPAGRHPGVRSCRAVFLEQRSAGYIDRNIKGVLAGFITAHGLSSRESQILEKMMRGYPTAAISARLGLSAGTVKNYKRRLYDKLDITNEREVFPLFIRHLLGGAEADEHLRSASPGVPARNV
jgi:DNA-binding CsgD family transcriptional regulator